MPNMHPAIKQLIESLSLGKNESDGKEAMSSDTITRLARVYEIARNALEYRADHLVRRAAIERILRRQMVFKKNASELTTALSQELGWAKYLTEAEGEDMTRGEIEKVVASYLQLLAHSPLDHSWLVGVMSAEIEEMINPNSDYHKFSSLAFNALRSRVKLDSINADLLLFVAVDRVYAQSDEPQIAYHLHRLIDKQMRQSGETRENEIWKASKQHYDEAMKSPYLGRFSVFVRRLMGPIVLLRDMYFTDPKNFVTTISHREVFMEKAKTVLKQQLTLTRGRMNRATIRSLAYVFLTKMIFGFILEVPVETWLRGKINYLPLVINLGFPVLAMWLFTMGIKLPGDKEQEAMRERAWQTVSDFDAAPLEKEILGSETLRKSNVRMWIFYVFYGWLFVAIFAAVIVVLQAIGFNWVNLLIFILFMSLVSFFAYRVRQTAQAYSFRPKRGAKSTMGDALMLPMITVGGWLSKGVARLNFLAFVFDFILEAPFKIILEFLDHWSQFLSARRDEMVE